MSIVYVVTSGDYSDYGIDAVFLNKAEAERFVETVTALGSNGYDDGRTIEEWPTGGRLPGGAGWEFTAYNFDDWKIRWSRSNRRDVAGTSVVYEGVGSVTVLSVDFDEGLKAIRERITFLRNEMRRRQSAPGGGEDE